MREPAPPGNFIWIQTFSRCVQPEGVKSGPMITRLAQPARVATWLLLLASILLLVSTIYRAEIADRWHPPGRAQKYYAISILGVCFWGIVTCLPDRPRLKTVIAFSAFAGGLYSVEIGLCLIELQSHQERADKDVANRVAAAKSAGVVFDTRSKFQTYQDLKRAGKKAVPSIHPSFFVDGDGVPGHAPLFPLGGVSRMLTPK